MEADVPPCHTDRGRWKDGIRTETFRNYTALAMQLTAVEESVTCKTTDNTRHPVRASYWHSHIIIQMLNHMSCIVTRLMQHALTECSNQSNQLKRSTFRQFFIRIGKTKLFVCSTRLRTACTTPVFQFISFCWNSTQTFLYIGTNDVNYQWYL